MITCTINVGEKYFLFCTFSISIITSSSEVQIMQTPTLNCRARRDLQLWYSNLLHLTLLNSPNWAHKLLLSWNPRIFRDLIWTRIDLLIILPYLQFLHTQAIFGFQNLLNNGLGPCSINPSTSSLLNYCNYPLFFFNI